MKFSTKLTVLFSAIILIMGTGMSFFVYSSNVKTLEAHIDDRLKNQAFHTMDKIDRFLFERYGDIKVLASDPVISSRQSTQKQITERLLYFRNIYRPYASLSFFDLHRVRIADTERKDIGRQHSFSEYWPEISGGKDFTYNISASESLKRTVFHFASVVKDKNGAPFGVVLSRIPIESLYEIVRQGVGIYNIEKDFLIELVDKDGLIIYSKRHDKEVILKETSPDYGLIRESLKKGLQTGVVKYTHSTGKREEEILVFTREQGYEDFKGSGWTLTIEIPTKVAFAAAVEIRNRILVISLIIGFFAFVIARLLSSRISMTIERLSAASEEVAKGNLDVKVDITTTDETGRLADAFNRMTTDLKEQREKLLSYRSELEERVKERTRDLELANTELKKIFNAIEQAAEAIVITDVDGAIQYVNPAFSVMNGYSIEDVVGRNPRILNSSMNPPELFTDMWRTILSGNKWVGTLINKKKTGELYHEEITVNPVINNEGKITNFIAIANDISDRIEAEENLKKKNIELEAAKEMAEAGNRAKSEFLANMSHELRTPLNAIIGFSDLLKSDMAGPITEEQRGFAGDIHESGQHLLRLISDILELSRIEAGKEELEITEFSLDVLIKESLMMFHEKAIKHNIKLTTDVAGDIGNIKADARKMKQVVLNLLSNATKFTPDGAEVGIKASKTEDEVIVTVWDTGIGIKEEDKQRLFMPFVQLERHLTKKYAGTGLGLTLCRKFVDMHGGRIWVESEFGKGSRFTFTIPR